MSIWMDYTKLESANEFFTKSSLRRIYSILNFSWP